MPHPQAPGSTTIQIEAAIPTTSRSQVSTAADGLAKPPARNSATEKPPVARTNATVYAMVAARPTSPRAP